MNIDKKRAHDIFSRESAVIAQGEAAHLLSAAAADLLNLLNLGLDEGLATEAGVHGHDQHQIADCNTQKHVGGGSGSSVSAGCLQVLSYVTVMIMLAKRRMYVSAEPWHDV